jgi:hypothetical protein
LSSVRLFLLNIGRQKWLGRPKHLAEERIKDAKPTIPLGEKFWPLARNRSKSLEAPSWLWSSVVALIALHETAYLEHCRQFALDT